MTSLKGLVPSKGELSAGCPLEVSDPAPSRAARSSQRRGQVPWTEDPSLSTPAPTKPGSSRVLLGHESTGISHQSLPSGPRAPLLEKKEADPTAAEFSEQGQHTRGLGQRKCSGSLGGQPSTGKTKGHTGRARAPPPQASPPFPINYSISS